MNVKYVLLLRKGSSVQHSQQLELALRDVVLTHVINMSILMGYVWF